MTNIERRALYHLLRMNQLADPSFPVELWQIEDYRELPLTELFDKLRLFGIDLNRIGFIAFGDECDSPEEFTDELIGEQHLKPSQEDQIYLLVFELWRRIMREKPSLSIICHELDHQIYLFDQNAAENPLELENALNHFSEILEKNVDEGVSPQEAIQLISGYTANDIETFLYDFISEQIEKGNESYSYELLDTFDPYLIENKWFKLLRLRLSGYPLTKTAQRLLEEIIEDHLNESDLDFQLELLSAIGEMKEHETFFIIAKSTLPLVKTEENLQDLLLISLEYFQRTDQLDKEKKLNDTINTRSHLQLNALIDKTDRDLQLLSTFFKAC